jgi:hypothetical protein
MQKSECGLEYEREGFLGIVTRRRLLCLSRNFGISTALAICLGVEKCRELLFASELQGFIYGLASLGGRWEDSERSWEECVGRKCFGIHSIRREFRQVPGNSVNFPANLQPTSSSREMLKAKNCRILTKASRVWGGKGER